ncbi:MAG: zinc ribbon domain-containing protein [Ruminococcaceae bacterium]|jgi:heme/copper-type cytochrome/quinol oxidase subunit 2|nr:zinc ribbon domain-containing protein [Oscillospiraceae bacterium]
MFCNKCSSKIPDGSVFCPECGQRLTAAPAPAQIPPRQAPQYVQPQPRSFIPPQAPAADPLNAPLTTGNFFWMPVVLAIPVVGLIVLLVWAFSKSANLNRKHYARATLIWMLISLILVVIVTFAGGGILGSLGGLLSSL